MTGADTQFDASSLPPPWDRVFPVLTRVFVWSLLFAIVYLLRSFFLLLFLTFVFTYIQTQGVELLCRYMPRRGLCVLLIGATFLGVVISIGLFIIPRVVDQAKLVADRYPDYLRSIDREVLQISESYPFLATMLPSSLHPEPLEPDEVPAHWAPAGSVTALILKQLLGFDEKHQEENEIKQVVEILRNIGKPLLAMGSAFLLALLFSVLIVYDLPRLRRSVASLAYTKMAFIYEEVADGIREFGVQLGRALGAQLLIAMVNTILTAPIIIYLEISEHLAFLSLIVFFCSFVPVAGVFISSVPICLLALQQHGVYGLLLGAGLIWLVHLVEAYVLNPKIFGTRLHVNPVLVLIILTIAGKLFGLWGLILSLPICTYFFGYVIRRRDPVSIPDAGSA